MSPLASLPLESPPQPSRPTPESFLAFRHDLTPAVPPVAAAVAAAAPPETVEVAGIRWTVPLFLAWLVMASAGSAWMLHYQLTPAVGGSVAADWPAGSTLTRAADRPTLLMFAHPCCPCSRASVAELHRLAANASAPLAIQLIFFSPAGEDAAWVQTDLWSQAQRIPGSQCVADRGGCEHRLFGARTSGETLLFGPDGTLRFQGGLTPSRGEQGESAGHRSLAALLQTGRVLQDRTPVFGCSLDADSSPLAPSPVCCKDASNASVAHRTDAPTHQAAK